MGHVREPVEQSLTKKIVQENNKKREISDEALNV